MEVGLCECKKQKICEEIFVAVMVLFCERGFDVVMVVEIVRVVDVLEKIVFNYFLVKEDLIVYCGYELIYVLLDFVRE